MLVGLVLVLDLGFHVVPVVDDGHVVVREVDVARRVIDDDDVAADTEKRAGAGGEGVVGAVDVVGFTGTVAHVGAGTGPGPVDASRHVDRRCRFPGWHLDALRIAAAQWDGEQRVSGGDGDVAAFQTRLLGQGRRGDPGNLGAGTGCPDPSLVDGHELVSRDRQLGVARDAVRECADGVGSEAFVGAGDLRDGSGCVDHETGAVASHDDVGRVDVLQQRDGVGGEIGEPFQASGPDLALSRVRDQHRVRAVAVFQVPGGDPVSHRQGCGVDRPGCLVRFVLQQDLIAFLGDVEITCRRIQTTVDDA